MVKTPKIRTLQRLSILSFAILMVLMPSCVSTSGSKPATIPDDLISQFGDYYVEVISVVDGYRIKGQSKSGIYTIKYIGIDVPGTACPPKLVQYIREEAKKANTSLLNGKVVKLERDVQNMDEDGSLLRYVWIKDSSGEWTMNEILLLAGLATATPRPPNVKYAQRFAAAETFAREHKNGMWKE